MPKAKKLERSRYLKIGYYYGTELTARIVFQLISQALLTLFGQDGSSRTGIYLIDSNDSKGSFYTIRCAHNTLSKVHAAICSINNYRSKPILIYSQKVFGTLNSKRKDDADDDN